MTLGALTFRQTFLVLALLFTAAGQASAQSPTIPAIVTQGLDLVVAGKGEEAVKTWSRAWQGEDLEKTPTLTQSLAQISSMLGSAYGYDLVKSFDISPNLLRLYYIVRYRRQPLYASFVVYRPNTEWTVVNVTWNTDGPAVFPKELLGPTP